MIVENKTFGAIVVLDDHNINAYKQDDAEVLQAIVGLAATAVHNVRLHKEVTRKKDDLQYLAQQLKEAQEKVQATAYTKAINQMSSTLAHKMNNLAGTIPLRMGLIREWLSSDIPRYERILEQLDGSASDARRLLEISKEVRGSIKPGALEHVDLRGLIDSIIANTLKSHPEIEHQIKIKTEYNMELPATLYVDRHQLIEIINNVIRNAVEAIPERGEITVLCQNGFLNKRPTLDILVRDTGKGIPTEILHKVFDLGFSTKETGLGLALGLARTFIKDVLSGEVDIESREGEGTTVTLKIPLERRAV